MGIAHTEEEIAFAIKKGIKQKGELKYCYNEWKRLERE